MYFLTSETLRQAVFEIWVHRPHRMWGFQGIFPPRPTSTLEVNAGDKTVWE